MWKLRPLITGVRGKAPRRNFERFSHKSGKKSDRREHIFTLTRSADERAEASVGRRRASATSWSLHCSCYQRTSGRASSAVALCVAVATRLQMFREHSACARRLAAHWRRAVCGSTQASAAERRLTVTPLGAWKRLGRTIPCLFDRLRLSSQHLFCLKS